MPLMPDPDLAERFWHQAQLEAAAALVGDNWSRGMLSRLLDLWLASRLIVAREEPDAR